MVHVSYICIRVRSGASGETYATKESRAANAAVPPQRRPQRRRQALQKRPFVRPAAHRFNALFVVRDASPRSRFEGAPERTPETGRTPARELYGAAAATPVRA